MKQWQAKSTSRKGTDACRASCAVPVKCLPEDCPRSKWLVDNGNGKWGPQQTVTISVQRDNSDAASTDDVDDDETKPKAAMKVDAGLGTTQTTGVGVGIVSSAASGCVRIVWARGLNAGRINGIYEVTAEMSGDMPIYAKVGDGDIWLEYYAPTSQWQVTLTGNKGTNHATAFCTVPAKCLPERSLPGRWLVYDGGKWVPQPAVAINIATQDEAGAYLAEVQREATRVVKGSQHVRITGATGSTAGDINGMYRPTQELCNNASVYAKVGNGDKWLEYNAIVKEWQVKETADKGTDDGIAYCTVPAKCLPEKCPAAQWQVYDGTKFDPQPAITIKQKKRER